MSVMLVAVALRLVAVLLSKGYMASDDHYETVMVASNWLCRGFYSDEGLLFWGDSSPAAINRFPLYTMFLHLIMRCYYWLGVETLDTMMYGVRLVHALLSLITVWAVYRIVALVSRSPGWAAIAGLIAAAHGLMPFLSVHCLIEMVGGHFLVAAFYLIYRYNDDENQKWLFWAGILTGLAWMIRLQIAAAALPIPFMLWWDNRQIKPAAYYCVGVLVMVLIAGVADYFVVGSFLRTMLNQLQTGHGQLYSTIPMLYIAVVFLFLIPPFSAVVLWMGFNKTLWREHRLIIVSIATFILIHSLAPNKQERFMLPIVPLLMAVSVLAVWYHFRARGFFSRHKYLFYSVVGVSLIVNMALLGVFTVNYGHKGLVEPMVIAQQMDPKPRVVPICTQTFQIYPFDYGGICPIRYHVVFKWSDLEGFVPRQDGSDLFFLYPKSENDLAWHLDSLSNRVGEIKRVFHVGPSVVDRVLHFLNPKYNPTHEVWGYRLIRDPISETETTPAHHM